MNERELFYELINFESTTDYEDLLLKCSQLLKNYISQVVDSVVYFEYNEKDLDDFLLKDIQQVQEKYAAYVAENPPARSRPDMITYLTQLTPAKFVDGAWLQGIFKAHNLNLEGNSLRASLVSDLFTIYVEELGEGVVEMNHIALWQQLLGSLGIKLPDPSSKAFANSNELWDSSFSVAVIQLALGHLGTSHLPEVLGYNMGFEQLPLHLLTTVDELKKLGMDSYYFQLHISIDNLASGHGAVAANAVKKYMDEITTKFGKEKADEHWRRILNGFYLNNVSPMKEELEKYYASSKQVSLEDKMVAMLKQKAPYANQMHADRQLGGCPLNKWLSPNATDQQLREFLDVLFSSHWINRSHPQQSPFLTDLCGFGGAMFHIFTRQELVLIEDWIRSNSGVAQPSEDTLVPDSPKVEKEEKKEEKDEEKEEIARQMAELIKNKSARAKVAHRNRTMTDEKGNSKKIDEWITMGSEDAMRALRHTYNLDKVSFEELEDNAFFKSVSVGRMKNYFTPSEVEVVRKWIISGAPITSSASTPAPVPSPSPALSSITPSSPPSIPLPSPRSVISYPSFKPSSPSITLGCPFAKRNSTNKLVNTKLSLPSLDDLSPPNLPSLFYQLVNVELYPHSLSQAKSFLESRLSISPPSSSSLYLSSHSHTDVENKVQKLISSCENLQQLAQVGKQLSLLFFMEGICLQNVNLAGFHHTHMNSELMKIFMNIWGYEDPLKNHHHMYNNLLKLLRVQIPPINSSFISNCGFSGKATEFAVLQLAASQFPRTYFTEILAFLEWNLSINKVILENLVSRLSALGGFTMDVSFKARLQEYETNIRLCKSVSDAHADDERARGEIHAYISRSGHARDLCCSLALAWITSVDLPIVEAEAVVEKKVDCRVPIVGGASA